MRAQHGVGTALTETVGMGSSRLQTLELLLAAKADVDAPDAVHSVVERKTCVWRSCVREAEADRKRESERARERQRARERERREREERREEKERS